MTLKLNQFNFSVIDAAATRVAARCVNSDVKTMCSTTAATRVRQRALRRGNARCVNGALRSELFPATDTMVICSVKPDGLWLLAVETLFTTEVNATVQVDWSSVTCE